MAPLPPLKDGQIYIGRTGKNPVAGKIEPGTGVIVTTGPGTIQIQSTGGNGGKMPWFIVPNIEASSSFHLKSNCGYIVVGTCSFSLPGDSKLGDQISILGKERGWELTGSEKNRVIIRDATFDFKGGKKINPSASGNCLHLLCIQPDIFMALSVEGSFYQ